MIESFPNVPPALLLLTSELSKCDSWGEMRRRVRAMLPELRNQSEAFDIENVSRDGARDLPCFEVHLHGALDILSADGCQAPQCRFAATDRIARSFGLLSDRVWITDLLTEQFLDSGRMTNANIDKAIADTIVLSRLMPLIEAGVIRFRSPWVPACTSCASEFEAHVERLIPPVIDQFLSTISIKRRRDGGYDLDFGACTEPPLIYTTLAKDGQTRRAPARRFVTPLIRKELHSIFWAAREAALTGGAVASNSRVGMAGLLRAQGRAPSHSNSTYLERDRGFVLPWVSDLDAKQIVQLRAEASTALPKLRERLHAAMNVSERTINASPSHDALIAELREQAAHVRAELELKRRTGARFWKGTYGILGLGISAYGVASEQLIPGVGGLLPILQLLMAHKAGHETDVARLKQNPGFVLVKAQELLAHADSK
jgi:hypothetical protein